MKFNLSLFFLVFFSLCLNAQTDSEKFLIQEGSWIMGGYVNASGNRSESQSSESRSFAFSIRPEAGYFISDNLALGMLTGYSYAYDKSVRTSSYSEYNGHVFLIAPYLKKYLPISRSFALNFTGSLEYSRQWSSNESETCINCTERTVNSYSAAIQPGLSYQLSNRFLLNARLGILQYSHRDINQDDRPDGSNDYFNFTLNLSSIYFGLSYLF
ncbi:porin family protein [Gramella sp. GC03-9]|uniref:Porin family protein n=1 Tax=Christiangramia oceanisediminis TaxID=2920386 RepID=A0A9X2KZ28_9FLAO|nr:outer membrane beta-barrel protein [Gramella oceanisediminis]MCP9201003.1 porin family protein [Gramella oceanisediminis]